MTTKRQVVTDEQLGQYAKREEELFDRLRFGIGGVKFDKTMDGLQLLLENRFPMDGASVLIESHAKAPDPLKDYRKIKGLTIIGPKEWEQAMMSKNKKNLNPLGLPGSWCPYILIPKNPAEIAERVKLAKEWGTTATLFLDLPSVGNHDTSLINQYKWWGVAHDNFIPGIVRDNIFWSNWFIANRYDWAIIPSVPQPIWKIKYELPNWTTKKDWETQKPVVTEYGLTISTATSDALYLNLMLTVYSRRLRKSTFARTATVYDARPLNVNSYDSGVYVNNYWYPEYVDGILGVAVEEVL